MIKNNHIYPLILTIILLTGCSSPEPELSYDPVELIDYQECVKTFMDLEDINGKPFCTKPVPK